MGLSTDSAGTLRANVANRLTHLANLQPDAIAVAHARRRGYRTATFAELDADSMLLARGLVAMGVRPGMRLALLVRPGVEFVAIVFALLRSGATMILVDAGLGKRNIVRCLKSTSPEGFIAIPQGHALRVAMRNHFPQAKFNVTVGRRWFWGGQTLRTLRELGARPCSLPPTAANDTAAIVFTSGSTGPPKGVLYRHETFVTQADEIQRRYGIEPGGVDLACFPLFGLFNVASGVTTVFPRMDFSRPASCKPRNLIRAANDWNCTQAFASPAVWHKLSGHCEKTGNKIPTLQNVFSCGAPVPARVLRRTLTSVHPKARMHTPYGATEALPVATIEASEVLSETSEKTDQGAGVCVGNKFDSIDWQVIQITDEPIDTIQEAEELPVGEIGELIVRGPQVSRRYVADSHSTHAKIADHDSMWHRMGDVGYFDDQGRFWYCGRKTHRVTTPEGTLFTIPVEAVFNTASMIYRSALVGVGPAGAQTPVVVYETFRAEEMLDRSPGPDYAKLLDTLPSELRRLAQRRQHTRSIKHFFRHDRLPVDIRHNSKIFREKLAIWAKERFLGIRNP